MVEPTSHPRAQALSAARSLLWRARSPLRISFAGGGSDFPHLFEQEPGAVICTAISLYATATLYAEPGAERFSSLDRDLTVEADATDAATMLPLHAAAARTIRMPAGYVLETDVPVPPGSGLGASSALVAAIVAAMAASRGHSIEGLSLGRLTYFVERQVAGIPGGLQDQYATAVGGICYMDFGADGVHVTRLDIPEAARAELESRMLLLRLAPSVQAPRPQNHGPAHTEESLDHVRDLRHLAREMRGALVDGRIGAFSLLLHEAWEMKRGLGYEVEPQIATAYETALALGALGGKQLGGPGGQHLLLLVDPGARRRVLRALQEQAWSEVPVTLTSEPTRVWSGRIA